MRSIPPPFPFPSRWDEVRVLQEQTQEAYWLVPSTMIPSQPSSSQKAHVAATHDQRSAVSDASQMYYSEELQFNSEWAARFSDTLTL